MHELGMARDLFGVILEKAARDGLGRISRIKLVVGEASGIDTGLLRHSFADHLFPGSPAEGAALEIETERVLAACSDCGRKITGEAVFSCPGCGGKNFEIKGGKDVYIEVIEGSEK